MWNGRLLWKRMIVDVQYPHGWNRALHRSTAEFTGTFVGSVGAVGKPAQPTADFPMFSICPEIHRRVLEIAAMQNGFEKQRDGQAFHFSDLNDGEYG